ncbi:NAD-dependent epimerase/dehydratase family protein [Dyadobacter sediminis]|uniref:NAD(P)-dependent oxidoreductase n=1 Tax=Dyadobacter sediminis TaxID=1493691 RepID=A0A5R9KF04_9BACT|nr:NAD(P)-dependent oxidoreductase [Dyadobacter sediminis]TLU94657.1 NAD(P)-dependent oxidoreductase [Dyadobacter sediminis]GGB89290.1 NAD-dependent dehydratase [Dyadobacter sediminis]
MKEKVFITGASGFIGFHLVETALKAGMEVHAAVRPSSDLTFLKKLKTDSLVFANTDFSSQESLKHTLEKSGCEYIIHAAGVTKAKSAAAYNLVNANYTLHLAQAALATGIPLKRFVFLSSLAAIGPLAYAAEQPITENTLPVPVTDYGRSKLLAENYLSDVENLPLTIIRPTAVYGPGEKDLFVLFKTLNKGLDAYIGNGPQRLSFVYVKDLVAATMAALKESSKEVSVYNISDGHAYDRYALADKFREISGKTSLRTHLPMTLVKMVAGLLDAVYAFSAATPVLNKEKLKELTAPNWICSIDAARNHLRYRPQYNLQQGLTETLMWYKENKWL